MPPDSPSLKARALRLLSTREHSRLELQRKLARWDDPPGSLTAILDDLQALGLIDEQRVLVSVLNRRSAKLGATRIKQELQSLGLSQDAVSGAMDDLQTTELERARAVWQKKFGTASTDAPTKGAMDARTTAKQMRFLAARGFRGDVIRRLVQNSDDEYP